MALNKNSKIYLAGHNGMVGSSILRLLKKRKYKKIFTKNKSNLDLLDQAKTLKYLKLIKPDFVIIAAAKVGGILANRNSKAEFIYENLMIQTNLIQMFRNYRRIKRSNQHNYQHNPDRLTQRTEL